MHNKCKVDPNPASTKASELTTIKKGTKEWDDAVKTTKAGGDKSINFRVETSSDAKSLLSEGRGNMNRYKRYTNTKYNKGYEFHPIESGTTNAKQNDLMHIKWKDWSNKGNNGKGHIFFNIPN